MTEPWALLAEWIEQARAAGEHEPEAMTLATSTARGEPSARIVLCRGLDARGLCFFTNYESRKAREVTENARAAAVFHWKKVERQARVEGAVERLDAAESDAYFRSRPRGSQLGAWASPQSQPIADLAVVRARADELARVYDGRDVPRPPFWGGFRIVPHAFELWTAGAARLHDRRAFRRGADGVWQELRLAP